MWRTNVVLQILHFACGSVYGDKERLRSGWNNGPRTNRICILLKDRPLQNIVVRGLHTGAGHQAVRDNKS